MLKISEIISENVQQFTKLIFRSVKMPRVNLALLKNNLTKAIEAGRSSQKNATNEGRYITLVNGKKEKLMMPNGTATPAGKIYYDEILGIGAPRLYAYEQPLIGEKWVMGFSGKKYS